MDNKLNIIFRDNYKMFDIETGIFELKKAGANQMECVKVIVDELRISLRTADEIVLNSFAWKDDVDNIIKFRNGFDDLE